MAIVVDPWTSTESDFHRLRAGNPPEKEKTCVCTIIRAASVMMGLVVFIRRGLLESAQP